jgi:UDP-GlcNAc:undecaprenyl-phosphate/decaprenyl-phosphate GlcNAc-1-phosphate transferase
MRRSGMTPSQSAMPRECALPGAARLGVALLACGLLTAPLPAAEAPAALPEPAPENAAAAVLKTKADKENYASGVFAVRNFKRQGVELNLELIIRGMRDAYAGGPLLMDEREIRTVMSALQLELRKKQVQIGRVAATDNRAEGDAFLAANKTKEGVVALPSGLQYKILKAGDGKPPTDVDTVECRYRATVLDGTEFDSTDPKGPPKSLRLASPEVIPGLREALKLMPVGSTWELYIPPQLAYGARGVGADVGPNATVRFEVELVGIATAGTPPAPAAPAAKAP